MEARKYSKKREAILEALRNTTEHPSAEMLYARLKPEFPDLSLGTVYRNLAMFIRDGDAVSVGHRCGPGALRRGHPSRTRTSSAPNAAGCWTSAAPASVRWTRRSSARRAARSRDTL